MPATRRRLAARMLCAGFAPEDKQHILQLIDEGLGAVILFARNITGGPGEVAELIAELKERAAARESGGAGRVPHAALLIAIDQEGGRVRRLRDGFSPIPAMRQLGEAIRRTGRLELARQVGRILGRELRAVSVDLNLAPVVDVDTNPDNPVIADRSLGPEPAIVGEAGAQLVRGMQEEGVAACCKHFPGHGDTSVDSHLDLPRLDHDLFRLKRIELRPYRACIAAGVAAVMPGHLLVPSLDADHPATMSRAIVNGLLRERMGFYGTVISDDFEMKALAGRFDFEKSVLAAVEAGVDLISVCHTPELQRRALDAIAGGASDQALMESATRLDRLFRSFARPPGRVDLSRILDAPESRRLLEEIGQSAEGADPTEGRIGPGT